MTTTTKPAANQRDARAEALDREFGALVGRTIKQVRLLRPSELNDLGWECAHPWDLPFVLIFDDDTAAVVSQDPEGNGPGWLLLADLG